MYWLVGEKLRSRIGTLESLGGVKTAEAEVDPDELVQAHLRYAKERDAEIPDSYQGHRPSAGVGGTRKRGQMSTRSLRVVLGGWR